MSTSKEHLRANQVCDLLKSEGYQPEIDDEGDIRFKHDGFSYYLLIYEDDTPYFHLQLPAFHQVKSEEDKAKVFEACNEVNRSSKLAKVTFYPEEMVVSCGAQMLLFNDAHFASTLKRSFSAVLYAGKKFEKIVEAELTQNARPVI